MGKGVLVAFGVCIVLVAAGAELGMRFRSGMSEEMGPSSVPKTKKPKMDTVAYAHPNGQPLSMDLYRPKAAGRTAAILLLHGGGWVSGSKGEMAELGEYIAAHGNLAASADYRLAQVQRWPAQLEDVQAAVRYLRENATSLNIDPDRIASVGISAGGHLSLFLGAVDADHAAEHPGFSSRVEAVGSISGLHDLRLRMTPAGENYKIIEALVGTREGPAVAAASPILKLDHKSAPTYFIQGADDPLVPPDQTLEASKKLTELGVPEEAETVPGMGHGLTLKNEAQAAAFGRMMDWILKHLDKKRALKK